MKIDRISMTAFEGTTSNYKLGALTLVTGDNRSGKSSVPNAIRVAAYGLLPRLGAMKTRRLMSGNSAAVCAYFSDGHASTVEWTRDEKGSVKTEATLAHKFPDVLLDFGVWAKLTEAQRVAWAFAAVFDPKDWNDDAVRAKLAEIPVAAPVQVASGAVEAVLGAWNERARDRQRAGGEVPPWLEGTVAAFKDTAKVASQEAKTALAQVMGLRNQVAAKPADESAALDRAKATLGEAQKRAGAAAAVARQAQEAASRLTMLRQRLVAAQEAAKRVKVADVTEKRLAGTLVAVPHADEDLDGQAGALRAEVENCIEQEDKAVADAGALRLAAVKMLAKDKCPTCLAEGGEWKARWTRLNDKQVAECDKDAAEAQKTRAKADKELAAVAKRQAARAAAVAKNAAVEQEIAAAKRQADSDRPLASQVDHLKEDIASAKAALKPDAGRDTMPDLEELTEAVRGLEARQQAFQAWQRAKATLADTEAKAVAAGAKADAFKLGAAVVTDVQRDTVAGLFGGLLAVANRFVDGFMPALEFRDGEFGYDRGGQWVSTETFSGTEELVAFAGLCVALAQAAPVKVVLLDEMGRLTPSNKIKLLARLDKLVADGVIDQAVCVDVDAGWLTPHLAKQTTLVTVQ